MTSSEPTHRYTNGNQQAGILASVLINSVIAAIVVLLRIVTRIRLVRNVGWDDYTIVAAVIGHMCGLSIVIIEVHYGFGKHRDYLTEVQYTEFLRYSYGEWIQTFQTLMFTKVSICCLLLRIPVEKYLKRPIQGTIAFLIVTNVVLTILWIVQCSPTSGAWNKQIPAKCFTDAQLQRIIISQAIISIISDFLLALSPIVLLWKVQIEWRIKAGLCVLMGLGLITAACCMVRTVLNWQTVNSDETWISVTNWHWRSWEVGLGIIAASIPTLRPGYRSVISNLNTFWSQRSLRRRSGDTHGNSSLHDPSFTKRLLNRTKTSRDPVVEVPARTAKSETGRARTYGDGNDSFAMQYLPGDQQIPPQAIRKTATMDIKQPGMPGSQRSFLESVSVESGEKHRDFM